MRARWSRFWRLPVLVLAAFGAIAELQACASHPEPIQPNIADASAVLTREGKDVVGSAGIWTNRLRFAEAGMTLSLTDDVALHLHSRSFGRGSTIADLTAPGFPELAETRVTYARGALREWYEPKTSGLEQGFTIETRPTGEEPLQIDVQVDGLEVASSERTDELSLAIDGISYFAYGGLHATDATGATLHGQLLRVGIHTIRIEIDDKTARYPIIVDPTVWVLVDILSPSAALPGDSFGSSLAIVGDTLVGTAPDRAGERGGASTFVRDGGVWHEGPSLDVPDGASADPGVGYEIGFDGYRAILATRGSTALVYRRDGVTWSLEASLIPPWLAGPYSATSVAILGDTAAVVIPTHLATVERDGGVTPIDTSDGLPPGGLFIYEHSAGTGWTLKSQFNLPGLLANKVALQTDHVFVSALGAIFVGVRSVAGSWSVESIVPPPSDADNDFARGVVVAGNSMLVRDGIMVGVYSHTGNSWSRTAFIQEAETRGVYSCFACSISIDADTLLIADPVSAAANVWRYRLVGGVWNLEQTLVSHEYQVSAVANSGDTAAVGNPFRNGNRGAVLVFSPRRVTGDACSASTDCASHFCADGVCCDSVCGGGSVSDCLTCARADRKGTCSPELPSHRCREPNGPCDSAEVCDGERSTCPADITLENGTSCGDAGVCTNGACSTGSGLDAGDQPPVASGPDGAGGTGCAVGFRGATGDVAGGAFLLVGLMALVARRRYTKSALAFLGIALISRQDFQTHSFELQSRDGSVRAELDSEGVSYLVEREQEQRPLRISVSEIGRPFRMRPVPSAVPSERDGTIEYQRDGFREWYEARQAAVEQGFDISKRPEGPGDLVVRLVTSRSLHASDDDRGLVTGDGSVHYGGVVVVDATSRRLAASLTSSNGAIELHVSDEGATYPLVIDPEIWTERARVTPRLPSLTAFDAAGSTLAFTHTGTPPTAVELYEKATGRWSRVTELTPSRFVSETSVYGFAVAANDSAVAVGSPADPLPTSVGSAFVFERENGIWKQTADLAPDVTPFGFELFGYGIAIDGPTLAVGAPRYNEFLADGEDRQGLPNGQTEFGAVFIYSKKAGVWSFDTRLSPPFGFNFLGQAVRVSGPELVTIANPPAAIFYERSGTNWMQRQIITLDDPILQAQDPFNFQIGFDGSTFVACAGDLVVYERTASTWSYRQALRASDTEVTRFDTCAARGTRIVAGSGAADHGRGAAYVFDRDSTGKWSQTAKLTASDSLTEDRFGVGMAIPVNNEVFVSSQVHPPIGQLYDFQLTPSPEPCASASDCAVDAFCVDGICCDKICGNGDPNDCQACSVAAGAAKDGVCGPVTPRLCRPARGECDVEDRCDGTNLECPADTVVENGKTCGTGVCASGSCEAPSSIQSTDAGPGGDAPSVPTPAGCAASGVGARSTSSSSTYAGVIFAIGVFIAARARRRFAVAATVALVLLFAHQANAQEPTIAEQAPNTNTTAALAKFDEGRKALEAGDYAAALAAFDVSNQLLGSPNSVFYMGRCYLGLGKTASAYTAFRVAYKQAQDRLVATSDKRYTATRDFAAQEAAAIEAKVPKLAIALPPDAPSSVVVMQNGVVVPRSSWGTAIDTDPGHVVVDVTGSRLEPFHEELELPGGETRRVDVQLTRVPTATMRIVLESRPIGLALRVDGVPIDAAELSTPRPVDPGRRVVEATAPGYLPFRWQADLTNEQVTTISVKLIAERNESRDKRFSTPRWMFWTAGSAAAATLLTATIVAIHADVRANNQTDVDPLLRPADTRESIRSEATAANVMFVAGGVFAAGTVVLAFTTDWRKPPTTTGQLLRAFTTGARF